MDNKWPLAGLGTTHSHGSRCCWGWRCWATVGWWGTWPRRRWWNVVPGKKKFFKTPSTPDYPKICSHYPPQLTTSIPPPHSIFHTTHYPPNSNTDCLIENITGSCGRWGRWGRRSLGCQRGGRLTGFGKDCTMKRTEQRTGMNKGKEWFDHVSSCRTFDETKNCAFKNLWQKKYYVNFRKNNFWGLTHFRWQLCSNWVEIYL